MGYLADGQLSTPITSYAFISIVTAMPGSTRLSTVVNVFSQIEKPFYELQNSDIRKLQLREFSMVQRLFVADSSENLGEQQFATALYQLMHFSGYSRRTNSILANILVRANSVNSVDKTD